MSVLRHSLPTEAPGTAAQPIAGDTTFTRVLAKGSGTLQFDATRLAALPLPPIVRGINNDSLIVELRGSDPDLMAELATVFIEQEPRHRRTLRDSICAADRQGLAAAAHSLRGSLFIFGADSAAEIAEDLEMSAEDIDLAHAYKEFEKLETELGKLTVYIKDLMGKS